MSELLSKLSSYNVFNYLLPGVVFAILVSESTHYSLIQHDIVVGGFLYYFLGLVISRFGSLVIEPILKRVSFVRFAEYADFVVASAEDAQIEVLSEANNTYRTFCSLFGLLLLFKFYLWIQWKLPSLKNWDATFLTLLLLLLFLFSYRKQTAYVAKRVRISSMNAALSPKMPAFSDEKSETKKAGA